MILSGGGMTALSYIVPPVEMLFKDAYSCAFSAYKLRPKIHDTAVYKRTCAVEQAVSCI